MAAERERSIRRGDLPAVVQRAAELAAREADPEEEISEEEVIRIAAELGLPAQHVRTALYEGAHLEGEPTFLDRKFGNRRITASREVPLDAERAARALEEYFTATEYMAVVRRQPDSITLQPLGDPVSTVARAFKRGAKSNLAAAELLEVSVHSVEAGRTHVTMRAAFKDERKGHFAGAIIGGTLLGSAVGLVSSVLVGAVTHEAIVAVATGGVLAVGAGGSIYAGIVSSIRNNYRAWRERTLMQTEGVLDRLEKGEGMKPPPPSWVRKLQNLGFGG